MIWGTISTRDEDNWHQQGYDRQKDHYEFHLLEDSYKGEEILE